MGECLGGIQRIMVNSIHPLMDLTKISHHATHFSASPPLRPVILPPMPASALLNSHANRASILVDFNEPTPRAFQLAGFLRGGLDLRRWNSCHHQTPSPCSGAWRAVPAMVVVVMVQMHKTNFGRGALGI